VQICPLQRPLKWESVVTFSSPTAKSFAFPVVGGQTMELAVAQFWSSGIGSHETTIVDFEVTSHFQIFCIFINCLSFFSFFLVFFFFFWGGGYGYVNSLWIMNHHLV